MNHPPKNPPSGVMLFRVGASLLAMVVNDNAGFQDKHVVLGSIASSFLQKIAS